VLFAGEVQTAGIGVAAAIEPVAEGHSIAFPLTRRIGYIHDVQPFFDGMAAFGSVRPSCTFRKNALAQVSCTLPLASVTIRLVPTQSWNE
jgi:hypothetical protein